MEAVKHNQIIESLTQADLSHLILPLVTIYEKPADFPNEYVARIWDGQGARPTNIMVKSKSIESIREDIEAAGDEPHIVETWM